MANKLLDLKAQLEAEERKHNKFLSLQTQLEEEERRKALEQQTVPYEYQTVGKNGMNFTKDALKVDTIPYTVDRSDYNSFASKVNQYTKEIQKRNETVTPENAKEYENYLRAHGMELGKLGTGVMMFAGGNNLPKGPINQALNEKWLADEAAMSTLGTVNKYNTNMEYRLGEKTKSFEDFKQRMAEGQGDMAALKKAVQWGREHEDTEAKQAQQNQRATLQAQYDALEEEWMQAQNYAYTGMFDTDQQYQEALRKADALEAQLDDLQKQIDASPLTPQDYTSKYVQENQQKAQDWGNALEGRYKGNDSQIQAFNDKYDTLFQAYEAALFEAENGFHFDTGLPYSTQERAEAQQRADELKAQKDAMETQAEEERKNAAEAVSSVSEAENGKGSVGRLVGALGMDVLTSWGKALAQAQSNILKPFEGIISRKNEEADVLKAILTGDTEKANKEAKDLNSAQIAQKQLTNRAEQYFVKEAETAQEEAYHARKALTDSEALDVAYEVAQIIGMMLPDIALTLATGGGSAAADATVLMQNTMTKYIANLGKSQLAKLAAQVASNPGFYSSFVREWGEDIEELKSNGTDPTIAQVIGTGIALLNAAIEVGGETSGIQAIGKPDADAGIATEIYQKAFGKTPGKVGGALLGATDTAIQEAMEEVTQGRVSDAGTMIGRDTAGKATPYVSFDQNENALINPTKAAREAAMGGLVGFLMDAGYAPVNAVAQKRAENTAIGEKILENDWGQALGQQAQAAGINNKTAQKLSQNALDAQKKRNQRKAGALYEQWFKETENSKAAREAAQAMLTQNRGEIVKSGQDAQEAIDTGTQLSRTATISQDGENRIAPKEGEEEGKPVEVVGVGVKDNKVQIKVKEDGNIHFVKYEEMAFKDAETAEKAAVAALVGGEELGNSLYNAQEPGTKVPFIEFAKKFAAAYNAAKGGAELGAIKAAGMGEGLTDGELRTAVQLGQANKQIEGILGEAKNRAIAFVKNALAEQVESGDAQAVAEAVVAREAGEELTDEQQAALDKYENLDLDDVTEEMAEEAPAFGAAEAYQLGLSGRRFEEVESTLRDMGMEVTDEIRGEFERGQAELAARETRRIQAVKAWNAGRDGSRVGVVRSIQPEEAAAAGVRTIQGPINKHLRDSITALRGLAESTGVNMVLFESPIKEGEHSGANGWYDSKTQTVYLDMYSGKGNEQALMRTASHELTHFIQDWSPAQYKKYRDFLLDHYYGSDNNAVKRLTQEQMDKDSTLDLPGAMDEVVADASEMMLEGDEDATKALAEKHPSLFVRIRGWIDRWAKALSRAWKGLSPTNEASRMLKASAEKFTEAQRMWWEALEDASVNLRGQIKQAEIEADREAKIQELRKKSAEVKERAEIRRQKAIERANAAQTAEEGQAAVQEAQQAQALSEAQERETKRQEKQINQEAKKKEAEAKATAKAGERIEKKLARMREEARDAVKAYAEENGIALDGSAKAGTALVKEAMHYYNQGAYGWPFNANTDAGKGELADLAQRMNAFGQEAHQQEQLEAAAEPATAEENVAAPAEETGNAEENVAASVEETVEESSTVEEAQAEPETTLEEIAGEAEPEVPENVSNLPENVSNLPANENLSPEADEEPTPEESAALEQQQQTAQKMGDVLKGMSKKAQNLVMKWGANEQVNVRMEDGSEQGIAFAQFAKKWYDAGRAGDSILHVEQTEEEMTAYPPFLQDEFYNAGKADAAAEEKAKQRKEKKKNEKPADQGTAQPVGEPGAGTGRLLEEVPAENVQEQGGGRDAVSEPAVQEQRDGGNDAGPDEPGPLRERGEGVHQRDDVRPATGEVSEEAEAAEEAREQLEDTVEDTDKRLEAETPKGTNYQIGDSLNLPSGEKARYKANLDAIRLLRTLEAENRYATPEEQGILSKYVGWGGLAQAFDESNTKWKKEYAELAELLTPDEYNAARASTTNAHYTSVEVIRAMYEGLRHLGFQGGRMLEPSGGIGHFIGAMPADMQQAVRSWTMVELDSITGRIAAKLYPNADVRVQGFETAKIGNNVMDVAIGNVPFGNFPIVDSTYPKEVTSAIHNYFFAKAIDKVRPGGLLMFITSRYTMDAQNSSVRSYMMERADLLGAVRLPYTAFKGNANTEVVTDILIFKKREAGTPYRGEKFDYSAYANIGGDYVNMNEYFVAHPEMVMGTLKTSGTMYRMKELNVEPKGNNLGQQITEAIGRIEARMDYSKAAPSVEELQKRAEKARANTKENGYEVKDGKIYQNQNGELKAVEMKEADAQKVKDMLAIRDTARALQELQKQGADKKAIADKRKELNKLYDAFTQKNGLLHNPKNAKLIEADPDHFFILALENYDKKAKTATKADIFSKDTIAAVVTVTHADTPQDAIAVVLNEKGYIDLVRAAELLSVTEDEAKAAMIDSGLAFLNEKGTLETRENYLSGDVRAKLRQAEALATVDDRYQQNVDELKKVIPEDVTRENIYVKPGATWIPDSVYEQFICDTLKAFNTRWRQNVKVTYIPASGEYTLELSSSAKRDYRNTQEWGTNRKTFAELLDALMNNRTINVYNRTEDGKSLLDEAATLAAREKAEKIQQRFREWLWENEDRAKALEKLYNDRYNAIVVPEYDGSGLTIAGANAAKQLRPHQKNVVHRIIQNGGNTLIAHCVGAGKTAEMAGAAMKLRQLGIVQKPVFVVPKALVGQWGREFLDFFPAAKILVLSENDFNAKNRKEFSNRIATGDYDAIIMSREQFGKVPMTEEYQKGFYQETIAQITAAMDDEKRKGGGKGMSVKNMEKAKKRLEAKLKSLETKKKDVDNINFEDMGIDSIFVDEAHEYKNLMFTSNMNNISGLGNKEGSQRAFDMYMKTKYLRSINGGRGIVFATATPVMNSMSEMYIMQKYLQEDKLNQLGINSFDAWANLFGEVMTVIEPTPSGKGFRQKEAFARFKNLPELQRLFRSFADVMQMQGLQDIMRKNGQEIKIPKMKGGKRITVECEPGEFQLQYIDTLAERAEKLRHGNVDPKVDNMLKITSEGRKLSYTQRMIDPSLPYEEGCKILKCVENVEQIYKESKGNKGTQLIFCDMATPKGSANIETENAQDMTEDAESVDFYGDIKRMLTAKGIPANEIAFIHDADTNEKRNKLFEDVNEGRVRVLIGSTGKMGVGMNAQKRIVALHHLDAPWRPGDIEQREGRALRQGNINDEVGIYVYVTKRTFDTRMWDNLYRKANFINQIMNGTNTAREVEGDGDFALSAAEIKAIATGDPMIVEQFEVNNQIKKLESLEREWQKDKKRARETIQMNNARIATSEALLPKAEADMKTAAALDLEKNFLMKIDGKRYTERAKANAPLLEAVKKHEGIVSEKKIGEIGGFTLYADGKGSIVIKGAGTYSVNVNFDSDTGTMTRVINQITGIEKNVAAMHASIEQLREENRSAEERMSQPFDKAGELEQLRARAEEIANILNPVEDQAGAANLDETEGTETEEAPKAPKSERNPDDLSDRQLLARAYEGIAKTDYEKRSLEKYKEMIAQLDADTEELAKLRKQIHDKTFIAGQVDRVGALKLREQADALAKKIAKTDKTLLNMQRSAALKGVLEVEKKDAQKKIREKIKGQMDRYNEGVNRREYAERIKKTTERLAKWIVQPDKNNHVPKALRQSVAKFLLTIQQGTSAEFRGQVGKRRERNFLANMRELQGIVSDISSYQMQSADERVQGNFGMYIDLPDGFSEQMADLIRSVEKTMQDAGTDFNVNAMTSEQMKTLYQVLSTISTSITHANDLLAMNNFRHVDQAAQNSVQFIRDQGKVEYWRGGGLHNFMNWENMQPVRAFERFGEGGEAIFKALTRGQGILARNVVEILKYTDPKRAKTNKDGTTTLIYSKQEAKEWSEQIKTFDVGGKKISMPVADVMSLYCLLKRGQAVGHIFGEGFRVADFKDKRGKLIAGSGVTITQDEAKQITDTLTARQKRVADKMQELMSTVGSRWGNYVSMKRFGYEMFTEKNYFPIEVDSDRLMAKTDESKGNELYRLLNLSSVKPITPNAKNRIMIKNIFDVFSNHMTDMAQYNALALPILDAVKWINYREKTETGDGSVAAEGIREAAREMYGNKAGRYIIELLKDLNGTQALGDIGEVVGKKMLMRFNRQAVAANLSVALKQPTSIIRAAMELGGLDLIRGAIGNQGMYNRNVKEMLEHSGIALWKDLGFYDVNVSRPVKNMVMQSDTAVDKLLDIATKLPEGADKITWAAIWGASKAWVKRNGGTFATTEEYWQAVTDKFEDVIYKTQVVDSLLTRSQFMRGTSFISKWLSSFMSEPTTTYNMLLEAMNRMLNDMRKGMSLGQAFAKHHKIIMRTTAVYLTSAAVMTLLEAVIGAWRDDDDYETFMEKFQAGLLNNALDEFLPFNLLPVVSDIYDYGKKLLADYVLPDEWNVSSYAGGDSPIYSALDTLMGAVDVADRYFDDQKGYTLYAVIYKTTNALSQFAGVPIAPAMREVVAAWNNLIVPYAPEMRIETYESNEKQGAAALYKAMTEGDKDREALVRRQLAANNADQKKLDSALKSLIKADEESGEISSATAEKYLRSIVGMDANDAWKQIQKWGYEAENDDTYTEYKLLEKAVISGTGIQQAMKDLTTHGKTEKEVQEHVRSVISEQTGKEKKMTTATAERLLRQYGGLDANAAWIRAQELTYYARTGTPTTSDIAMMKYAVEKHQSPKEALDGLLAHGKEKKNIASSVTSAYKEQYLQLRSSNPSQAATLKGQLISIFEYLGYNGKKKVEDWEKKQK